MATWANASEVLGPWLKPIWKELAAKKNSKKNGNEWNGYHRRCPIEEQFMMEQYDMIHDSIRDYTELAQQFGYDYLPCHDFINF